MSLPLHPQNRRAWLDIIADRIKEKFKHKYLAGQEEHGGDLGTLGMGDLLDQMEAEALDQLAYIAEMRRQLACNGLEERPGLANIAMATELLQ